MKRLFYFLIVSIVFLLTGCIKKIDTPVEKRNAEFGIVIHGGAGNMKRERISEERQKEYRAKLQEAIDAGYKILEEGGSSLDAVEAAINVMEDSPLFNSARGAVLTAEGTVELDASIMNGKDLNAGAVAGVKHIKNPISLARLVMNKSPHVMLAGKGAEVFAKEQGVEFVDQKYFLTERRIKALERIKKAEKAKSLKTTFNTNASEFADPILGKDGYKFGTVGCVALDKAGNLAAGTSTGGMSNKKFGRIGDSPIIGAGTYANNKTCAVSATGHGEFFIRNCVTHDISALMQYKGYSLKKAANEVIMKKLVSQKAEGGIVSIDKNGNVAMVFNTSGMFRGYKLSNKKTKIAIFSDVK